MVGAQHGHGLPGRVLGDVSQDAADAFGGDDPIDQAELEEAAGESLGGFGGGGHEREAKAGGAAQATESSLAAAAL
jgi:hypothetical protein